MERDMKDGRAAWSRIEKLVEGVPGWTPLDELFTLYMLSCTACPPQGCIVEVGAWCGRTSVVLGESARATGTGPVHAVDLFPERDDWSPNADGSHSIRMSRTGFVSAQRVWREPFERDVLPVYDLHGGPFAAFGRAVGAAGLESTVLPHRGTSRTFAAAAGSGFRARLIFLDGDHTYGGVLEDLDALERFLMPGGWICFDDAFTCYEGVDRAIGERIAGNPAYDMRLQPTRKLYIARKAGARG